MLNMKCRTMLMDVLLDKLSFQSHDVEGPTHRDHVAMETGKLRRSRSYNLCKQCLVEQASSASPPVSSAPIHSRQAPTLNVDLR